jgi:hypothetical protein
MDKLMTGLVLFLTSVNVFVLACATPEMHHLLFPTFRMGWQSRDQNEFAQTNPIPAFQKVNHRCQTLDLSQALQYVVDRDRKLMLYQFRDYIHLSLSIHGTTIKLQDFLNFDLVKANSNTPLSIRLF